QVRTGVQHAGLSEQVQPAHPRAQRKQHEPEPGEDTERRMTTRRAVLGAIAVAWLLLGLYGVASYGHNYYVYRGYDPPHDPAHVAGGRLVTARFYSPALHARRSYLIYLPPGYSPRTHYPVLYLLHGAPGWPRELLDVANL